MTTDPALAEFERTIEAFIDAHKRVLWAADPLPRPVARMVAASGNDTRDACRLLARVNAPEKRTSRR
jgi:hypothetical protein